MRLAFAVLAALPLLLRGVDMEDVASYERVAELPAEDPASTGRHCRVRGAVSHVSALRPGLFILAPVDAPYRQGIPVMIPSGIEGPREGDDVWVRGRTAVISGRVGILAEDGTAVSSVGTDFARQMKVFDFRNGLVDWRRVWYEGTVRNISEMKGVTVLSLHRPSETVHVRVPGTSAEWGSLAGKMVRATGCVFPVGGENGTTLGRCIEVSDADDVELLVKDWTSLAVWCGTPVLSVAFFAVFVAWVRSRREMLRMAAVMAERNRMARDLHDTIEQHLATVRLLIGGIANLKDLDSRVREPLRHAAEVLANAKIEVREAVMDLRSDESLAKSPSDALKELAASVTAAGAVKVRTALRGLPDSLPQDRYQDLLLIAREAITNAIKHGKAKNIVIVSDPGWTLMVLNDGAKFDVTRSPGPETGHYGLSGMMERAKRCRLELSFVDQGRWCGIKLTS